jgi:hypothetical protein
MLSIGQTWVLASIGAVVEMGVLSTLKRLLMESTCTASDMSDWLWYGYMKVGCFWTHPLPVWKSVVEMFGPNIQVYLKFSNPSLLRFEHTMILYVGEPLKGFVSHIFYTKGCSKMALLKAHGDQVQSRILHLSGPRDLTEYFFNTEMLLHSS